MWVCGVPIAVVTWPVVVELAMKSREHGACAMLTSLQNPTIKLLRKLHQLNGRRDQQRFLVEGTHLVEEAIHANWPMSTVFFTIRWSMKHESLLEKLDPAIEKIMVSDQVMLSLATTQTPDGVLAVAHDQEGGEIPINDIVLAIAAERLQNPDNLGSLIRASAACGADGVMVGQESVDRSNPKVLRASVGQWFRQPPRSVDLYPWLRECRRASIQVLGAAADGVCHWDADLTKPTIFVLGNEGAGISNEMRQAVDGIISIPMAIGVDSLNVGVAGAVLLYEALRQRRQA